MFITDIRSFDKRWPKGDSDCQDFFHKLLTFQKLKPYIKKIGREAFEVTVNNSECLQSYGIEIDEILNGDLTLIHRKNAK